MDNYRKFSDIEEFIKTWRNDYSDKYFRDNSGKNLHFYKNNFHDRCISSFCYKNNKLIALGTISPPINNASSYVIGKALYKEHPVLSEFIDYKLYEKAKNLGAKFLTLGDSTTKGLLKYKKKYLGSIEHFEYFGKVKNEI